MNERSSKNGEFVLGLAFIGLSGFVIVESLRMPYWEGDLYLMGPGFVPFLAGAALLALSIALITSDLLQRSVGDWKRWFGGLRSDPETRRLIVILGLIILYGAGLVGNLHFAFATFIFHALIFWYLKAGGFFKITLAAIVATLVVSVVLPKFFELPMP